MRMSATPRHPRLHRVTAGFAVFASILLAACGDDHGQSSEGTGGAPASTSQPAASTPRTSEMPTTTPNTPTAITVRSAAFADGEMIPTRYSCRGSNTPPPLNWTGVPPGTASIALVMDDPDAPGGTYTHWVIFNLPPQTSSLAGSNLPAGTKQAQNSGGKTAYLGPCPPSGVHHYRFTVYAQRTSLTLPNGAALQEALTAIKGNATAAGQLTGLFGSG